MKDKIKHIKVLLENHVALSDDEDNVLLDYITNLQEENERINKAIEYIQSPFYIGREKTEENILLNILNILQGEDE